MVPGSTGLVACLADRHGLGTTAVFGISQRLLPPTMCRNLNPDASFDRGCWSKMGPHFRLKAVPRMKTENVAQKITSFGSIRLMIDFAARKRSLSVLKAVP